MTFCVFKELLRILLFVHLSSPSPISDGFVLPAAIVCSSGTTGPPKAVALSHAALLYQLSNILSSEFEHGCAFSFSSLYWLSGWLVLLATTIGDSIRVITVQQFSPELLVDIIKTRKLSALVTPPLQLATVLRSGNLRSDDLNSVASWMVGGGHVAEENCLRMNEYLKNGRMVIGYGCSEVAGVVSTTSANYKSVGQLAKGVSLKIIDNNGQRLGPGERGEICLTTIQPICGYYNNEEATRSCVIDGWMHTGDVGYVDASGDVYVVDRIKDIFKVGNYHIDPSELEKVIEKIQGVVAVSVFGLPDPVYTNAAAAMVVTAKNAQLSAADVNAFVEKNLPSYKWLKGGVHFVEEMPMTSSGKILKRKCMEIVINKRVP